MKQIEVQIMGQGYLLGCPDGGEAKLRDAVERVNAAMCKIRDGGKVRARDRIAVLAALNLASELSEQNAATEAGDSLPANPGAMPAGTADQQLMQLVRRLDTALGRDGRLL